jgi:ABC-type tungstate transport system substrate-binding protein
MDVALYLSIFIAMAVQLADYYTTIKGMDKGLKEANPVNRWLFKKMGLPLTTFIEAGVVLAITTAFAAGYSYTAGTVFSSLVIVGKLYTVTRNLILLRKAR